MSGRDATRGNIIRVLWLFCLFCILFFNRATDHTSEPIFAHNRSKDAVWCKEDPSGNVKCVILKYGVVLQKNTLKIVRNGQVLATKMSNNFQMVNARIMSMNHDSETGVALSDSVNKTCVKCPLTEISRWRHFWLAINLVISETMHLR